MVGCAEARSELGRALVLAKFDQANPHFGSRFRPDAASVLQAAVKMPTLPHPLADGAGGNSEIRRCGFNLLEKGLCFVHKAKVV